MSRRKKKKPKESKQYPIGKEDLRALPASPTRRTACEPILRSVVNKIETQLTSEREQAAFKASRALQARELYANLVDVQLRGLAK